MKASTILTIILAAVPTAVPAQEKTDTLLCKSGVDQVVISESRGVVTVAVKGNDADGGYHKEFTSVFPDSATIASSQHEYRGIPRITIGKCPDESHWRRTLECNIGLHIGFVAATNKPRSMRVNAGRINDISLLDILSYRAARKDSRHAFSFGFGLSWRYISLKNSQEFFYGAPYYNYVWTGKEPEEPSGFDEDGTVSVGKKLNGHTVKNSRVGTFSLSFPLLWHYTFAKNHKLTVGPIFNYNVHGSLKTTYAEGNTESQSSTTKIGYRPFTVDAYAAITIAGGVNAYARYTPMHFFKDGRGPEMQMLSFGLAVGL